MSVTIVIIYLTITLNSSVIQGELNTLERIVALLRVSVP